MSYILDALQRADAERERGQVPGLHSKAAPLGADAQPRPSRRQWLPAAGVALAGIGLILLWQFWPRPAVTPVAPATPAPAATPAQPPQPSPPPEAPATPNDPPLPILAPKAPVAPDPGPAASRGVAGPIEAKTPVAASAPAPAPAPPPASDPGKTAPAATPEAPAPLAQRVPSFAELPADARSRLPQVSVSGATYSANPDHRMLIVNGQVLKEGQEIQPGFRLESIGPRSAVLDHQGLRYSIGY